MLRIFTTIIVAFCMSAAIGQDAIQTQEVTPVQEAPKPEFKPKGGVYGVIYANYNQQYVGDSMSRNEMVLERAYLGYKNQFDENWSADVKIDVSGKTESETGKRPTYLKEAYVKYSNNKFSISGGMQGTPQVAMQLKHWGNRYICNTASDMNQVGVAVADIGIVTTYKFNDMFSADFSVFNGEGYSYTQADAEYLQMLGVTANLPAGVIARVYGSFMADTVLRHFNDIKNPETVYGGLLGIKTLEDKLVVGLEYSNANDLKNIEDNKINVTSAYLTYLITPKIQGFVRGDLINTDNVAGKTEKYLALGGAQYIFNKNVQLSLDVQQTKVKSNDAKLGCFVHTQIKF